jgi:hypothetical protein
MLDGSSEQESVGRICKAIDGSRVRLAIQWLEYMERDLPIDVWYR